MGGEDGQENRARLLVEDGYHALEIVVDGFDPAIGGSQLVIFDLRRVVVVIDDRDAHA